nr:MAG: putative maturation protein [Leviviridae sp.]
MLHRIRRRLTPMPGGGKAQRIVGSTMTVDATQIERSDYPAVEYFCDDWVNRRHMDNPLEIVFESRNWIPLNGEHGIAGTSGYRMYKDYFPSYAYSNIAPTAALSSSIPSVGTVATAVLARSNPSKPYVSVPNFLYELKDLPGMIRDIGRLRLQAKNLRRKGIQRIHPKVAASHYLSYEMGWRPLISDLRKLLDFQAQVDKKYTELHNLYNKGGIQRRVRSPAWKATLTSHEDSQVTVESLIGVPIHCRQSQINMIERWGTVRWQPRVLPSQRYSNQQLANLARDLTFGMKGISAKQVWDAIPWTWLIGWFSNADEFLQAHDNTIPLVHSTPCIMTKTFIRRDWVRVPGNAPLYTGGEGATIVETKERTTSSGSLSATIPFLNGRQLSILGALAIQRKR